MLAMFDHGVPSVSLSYYTAEHSFPNWGKTPAPFRDLADEKYLSFKVVYQATFF